MYQTSKIEDFNVLIHGKGLFDLPVKNEAYKKIIEMSRDLKTRIIEQQCFPSLKNQKKDTFEFLQNSVNIL